MVRHQRLWLAAGSCYDFMLSPCNHATILSPEILQNTCFQKNKPWIFLQNHEGSQETSFTPSGTFPPAAQNRWLTTQENRYALVCPQSHQAGNFWVLTTTGYTTAGGSCPTLVSSRGCHSLAVYPGCMSFHFLPRLPILRLE